MSIFTSPEDDGLRECEEQCQEPGWDHHQPGYDREGLKLKYRD